ncbi:MAG: response regulator transcription factor [Bacteroidota bacterium]
MENTKTRILYVEDDETLSFITRDNLTRRGYEIVCCSDGKQAIEMFRKEKFSICILDIMLPKADGFEVAEYIRKSDKNIPILFLTAKSLTDDKIKGLTIGGDDYITKPFSIDELVLKIEIFLKRSIVYTYKDEEQKQFELGKFQFDYETLTLTEGKHIQRLTLKEADLLRFLCTNQDKILSRPDILNTIWGNDSYFIGRSLDVFISRLRKYLRNDEGIKIENLHGIGFKFTVKKHKG